MTARCRRLDQRIAIKVIAGELATANQVSLLKREVRYWATLV